MLDILMVGESPYTDKAIKSLAHYSDGLHRKGMEGTLFHSWKQLLYSIEHPRKYTMILDSDDLVSASAIDKHIAYLEDHTEFQCILSECILIDGNDQVIGKKKHPRNQIDMIVRLMRFEQHIGNAGYIVRSNILRHALKEIPSELSHFEHRVILAKLLQYGRIVIGIEPVYYWRKYSNQQKHRTFTDEEYYYAEKLFRTYIGCAYIQGMLSEYF